MRLLLASFACALLLGANALLAPTAAHAQGNPGNLPAPEPSAAQASLPVLNYMANEEICDTWVEVQNVGSTFTRVAMVTWGAPGFCPPQCAGPLKVECSGLLKPGSTWNFLGAQVPTGAKSAILYSLSAKQLSDVGLVDRFGTDDIIADLLCETLFFGVVGDCDDFRRFKIAYDQGLDFAGLPMDLAVGQPIAAEVLRRCQDPDVPGAITSKYQAISGIELGRYDPVFGGFAYYAPLLYGDAAGFESTLYVQNLGLDCSTVEIWFQQQDNCLRALICEVFTLAPGETFQFSASDCVGPGWIGSAWLRTSQAMGLAVDHIGRGLLMTYSGQPQQLRYAFDADPVFTAGSTVAYGPLVYSEYQGWDTGIQVQNLSGTTAAKAKVYFLDRSGDIITTLVDWICPRGSQTFYLPAVADLPGNWIGTVRVESQQWFTPGGPDVSATPITAVAHLIKYADIQRTSANESIAYNLLPEFEAYDWQIGRSGGGTASGAGLLAVPSLLKDLDGTGVTTELAIANFVPKPGFTDFAIYVYDMNGLIDFVCEKLNEKQVEYIDLQTWGYLAPGFKGSAIISAVYWEHDVFSPTGAFVRNALGLGAAVVERTGTPLGENVPGDQSAGSLAIPIDGPFAFMGLGMPQCPGLENAPDVLECPDVTLESGELFETVPDGGQLRHTISTSRVPEGCQVQDVDVFVALEHADDINELIVRLESTAVPQELELFSRICQGAGSTALVTTIDDDAGASVGSACPAFGGRYATESGMALELFEGTTGSTDWVLEIEDAVPNAFAGRLLNWSVILKTFDPDNPFPQP